MVFKLVQDMEKRWRRIKGYKLIPFIVTGEKFKDREPKKEELKILAAQESPKDVRFINTICDNILVF